MMCEPTRLKSSISVFKYIVEKNMFSKEIYPTINNPTSSPRRFREERHKVSVTITASLFSYFMIVQLYTFLILKME